MKKHTTIAVLILAGLHGGLSQGFVNLGFESANLSGYGAGSIPATNAIPGWTAYLGGLPLTNINYNVGGAGGIQVDIIGSTALQGNYYIYIAGSSSEPASIGQTGTIPLTAQSLIWWGSGASVSFNGQSLPISVLGQASNYSILGVNISALAGQTGQLLFTSALYPIAPGNTIDNIQFSSSPIPEPNILTLFALGGLGFLWYRRRT